MDDAYISVDVETSGPIPGEYSMLSLGACLVEDINRVFYVELKPTTRKAVPEALRVSGFDLDALAGTGEEPRRAIQLFSDWVHETVGNRGPVFVGFNAAFDWSFVNWYFHSFHGDNPFGIAPIDVKSFYMGLSGVAWKETTSRRLPLEFQPAAPTGVAHNALDDARRQAEIFRRMLRAAPGKSSQT
jgi:ribonuclease T